MPNHGSFWLRPAFDDMTSLWVAVGVRIVALQARVERRPECAGSGRDTRVADLRVEPIGAQVAVVIERHLDGVVDREPERRLR
ncbi:MAG: hypothetical protein DMF91_26595 [Acidobacteria bacterium]|nr:MAG: hypothetical protein DMF91_26595 [Acidobacteriota bacterium]